LIFFNLTLGVPAEKIVIFGRSLGSGPAVYLSSKRKAKALILMSSFKSIRGVVQNFV